MRVSRVALAACVLAGVLALALVGLLLLLPRVIDGAKLRRFAEVTAERTLGRRIGYERPTIGVFPPALVLERAWIEGDAEAGPRLLEAERVALELALGPLLERRLVVRSIVLDAPVLRLTRGPDGIALPALARASDPAAGTSRAPRVAIAGGRLLLRDTVASPPVVSELRDVNVELAASEGEAQLAAQGSFAVGDGGARVGGLAIGSGAQARFALEGSPGAAPGRIEVDAGSASLVWPGIFSKPAGLPATLSGGLRHAASGGIAIENATLRIGEMRAQGSATVGPSGSRFELGSDRLDARALAAILPFVARIPGIDGPLAIRTFRVETRPLVILADLELEGMSLAPGTPEPLRVRGPVALRGNTVQASGLAVEVGGQPMTVDGEVALGEAPTYAIRGQLRGADAKAFFEGILTRAPRIEGRLDLDADLRGPLDTRSLVDTAEGRLLVHVVEGRIAGVSVLEKAVSALSALERLSGLSRILGTGDAGAASPEAAGDRFQTLDATVQQAQGVSRTDDLRIVYPTYHLALSGELRASEGTVNMSGDIRIGEGLVGPIGQALGLVGLGCAMPNRIPVPEISGPTSDLQVRPDAGYLVGFVARCNPLDPLRAVGEGILRAPGAVRDALGLGGAGSEEADPAQPPEQEPASPK